MNRVIYFLRLEMDEKELYEIVILIIKLLISKFDLFVVVVIEWYDKDEVRNMLEEIKEFLEKLVYVYWLYNKN